jgi:hypothetical protein
VIARPWRQNTWLHHWGLSVTVCSKRANIQFDELEIRSCDCKRIDRVTVFVTEVCGAAIHSCVFTTNTPDTTVVTATCTIGDSLELRDPRSGTCSFCSFLQTALQPCTTTTVTGISEILNEPARCLKCIPRDKYLQNRNLYKSLYSFFICTEISQGQIKK